MDTVLIRERYKVVQVLWSEPDYALVEAVDIQERETPSRLINLYEGRLLHRYGRICADIRPEECPAFRGMFLCWDTLAVVFDSCGGASISIFSVYSFSTVLGARLKYRFSSPAISCGGKNSPFRG